MSSIGTVEVIVGIGGVMMLCGIAGGIIAGLKNRDISFWIGWSFVLPPALVVLLFLPTHRGPRPRRPTLDDEDRRDRQKEDF